MDLNVICDTTYDIRLVSAPFRLCYFFFFFVFNNRFQQFVENGCTVKFIFSCVISEQRRLTSSMVVMINGVLTDVIFVISYGNGKANVIAN